MTVIATSPDGKIYVFTKGADSVLKERITINNDLIQTTDEHLVGYAKKGLRTLCFSYKGIELEDFVRWEIKLKDLKTKAIIDKSLCNALEVYINDFEIDCMLLGCTGLEDKLQEEVVEDIRSFFDAGINVWMLTGDKLDTAESIGYSCKLFDKDTEVYKIKTANLNETK